MEWVIFSPESLKSASKGGPQQGLGTRMLSSVDLSLHKYIMKLSWTSPHVVFKVFKDFYIACGDTNNAVFRICLNNWAIEGKH